MRMIPKTKPIRMSDHSFERFLTETPGMADYQVYATNASLGHIIKSLPKNVRTRLVDGDNLSIREQVDILNAFNGI